MLRLREEGRRKSQSPSPYPNYGDDGDVQIEELSENDMGYDADLDVVRPDQYEDVESDTDEEQDSDAQESRSLEDELAIKLKQLYCDREQKENLHTLGRDRGRKRRSKEMQSPGLIESLRSKPSDLEITELIDDLEAGPPTKRRKARSLRKAAIGHSRVWPQESASQESSNSVFESAADTPSPGIFEEGDTTMTG